MARTNPGARPVRTLLWFGVLFALVFGTLASGVGFSNASWAPKLGLDLAGGTQIVLTPVIEPGQGEITEETINEAIGIIRQRVDSTGVAEAEITSQGGSNIVIELPGDPSEQAAARDLVGATAQMRFRPVLVEQPAAGIQTPAPTDGQTPAPTDGATPDPSATVEPAPGEAPAPEETPAPTQTPEATLTPAPSATSQRAVPQALVQAPPAETPPAETPAAETPAAETPAAETPAAETPAAETPAEPPPAETPAEPGPAPEPTDASDLAQITEEVAVEFEALDCSDEQSLRGLTDDAAAPLVTCNEDGTLKYILGPVEVEGVDIDTADAGLRTSAQGFTTNEWVVNLAFDGEGTTAFREVTTRLVNLAPPQNQFAIVLDGLVVSAPRTNNVITDGRAEISGSFTQESSTQLANQLKFGALPLSFEIQTEDQISALLGEEQLQRGLLAGGIGLLLVVLYSLLQYRALGLVTVASLVVVGLLTYGVIAIMSWYQGYRLSLAGVAGLIVAIGITADSFIVFFERVRDEVREGKSLAVAVEQGWKRARRTILASDAISFLAAVVLYLLAVGGVRGFAFTLGLTTVLDLIVVILFTHPLVALLARTKFYGGGHKLSGFDAEHLGRTVAYAGRGRVRTPEERGRKKAAAPEESGRQTIAQRKAAAAAAAAAEEHDDAPSDHETRASAAKES